MNNDPYQLPERDAYLSLHDLTETFLSRLRARVPDDRTGATATDQCPDGIVTLVRKYKLYTELTHVIRQQLLGSYSVNIRPTVDNGLIRRIDVTIQRK